MPVITRNVKLVGEEDSPDRPAIVSELYSRARAALEDALPSKARIEQLLQQS